MIWKNIKGESESVKNFSELKGTLRSLQASHIIRVNAQKSHSIKWFKIQKIMCRLN